MTPDEAVILNKIGHNVVSDFVAIVNSSILMTIYTWLVIKAGSVLLSQEKRRSKASISTMGAIITMYIVALVLWTLDFTNFVVEAKLTLIQANSDDGSLDAARNAAVSFIFKLSDAEDALYSYMSLLGDAIIIWRVYMLTPHGRRWIVIIPSAVLLGSLVATLMLTYCAGHLGSSIVTGTFQSPAFCKNVQMATYCMAFATTTIATFLIGLTTWNYRRSISPYLSNSTFSEGTRGSRRGQVERVLLLLVESGLLYFIFFGVQVIGDIPPIHNWIETKSGLMFAFNMYSFSSSVLVGIYPTAIVVLSHSKHAVIDHAVASASTFRAAAPPFALQTATAVTVDTIDYGAAVRKSNEIKDKSTMDATPPPSLV